MDLDIKALPEGTLLKINKEEAKIAAHKLYRYLVGKNYIHQDMRELIKYLEDEMVYYETSDDHYRNFSDSRSDA